MLAVAVFVDVGAGAARTEILSLLATLGFAVLDQPASADTAWVRIIDATSAATKLSSLADAARQTGTLLLYGDDAEARLAMQMSAPATWAMASWPLPPAMLNTSLHHAIRLSQLANGLPLPGALEDFDPDTDPQRRFFSDVLAECGLFDFEYDLATGARRQGSRDALMLGRSPGTFAEVVDIIKAEDRASARRAFECSRSSGAAYEIEVRAKLKDGRYYSFRSKGIVIDRTRTHPGKLVGVSWNVQRERDAKDSALAIQQRLNRALETAGMFSWEWRAESDQRLIVGNGIGIGFPDLLPAIPPRLDDFIAADQRADDLARFRVAVQQQSAYQSTVLLDIPGRGMRHVLLTAEPMYDENGDIVAMSGLGLDVNEHVEAANGLAKAKAWLVESLAAGRMYCWEINLVDGSRTTIGPDHEILGSAPTSTAESTALLHPDDAERCAELLDKVAKQGCPYQLEFRVVRPDGQIRWISSTGKPVLGAHGGVERITGVAVDITERRLIEEEMALTNERLSLALNAASLNPWSVDLEHGVTRGGPRDVELFGAEIRSKAQFEACVLPADRAVVATLGDPQFLASGIAQRMEYRVVAADGSIRWVASHAQTILDNHGRPKTLVGVSYDISQSKNAQEKLAKSLSDLERVQSATNVIFWEWDRATGPRLYQLGGMSLAGGDVPALHADDQRRIARKLLRCAAHGEPIDDEIRFRLSGGRYGWIALQAGRSQNVAGRGATVFGVALDISARRQNADKLRRAEDRLKRALDAAKMTCWDWYRNPQLEEDDQAEQYSAKSGSGVIHPADQSRHRAAIKDAMSLATPSYRCEFRVIAANSTVTWLLSIGSRVEGPGGQVLGLTGVAIDVTAAKATEAALAESLDWQRLATAAGELNLWRVDIESGVRQGGEMDARLFGFSPDRLQSVEDLIHAEDRPTVDAAWLESTAFGKPYHVNYRIVRPGGEATWLRERGKRVVDPLSGRPQMVGATMDVSEQMLAVHALRSALLLAHKASAAKSAFVAGMSHEIRTPLNAVVGFADLLAESTTDDRQLSHLRSLKSSSAQLMSIVNDVLDFSRIEAGEMVLEDSRFVIQKCLEGALDMVAGTADSKGLCLLMTCEGDSHTEVMGDVGRVRQVVLNLLANAIKFTGRGAVTLSLSSTQNAATAVIRIVVEDTGIGIHPDSLDELFRPFHQGDVSTTRRFGGTGLGLSISRQLVQLMGGHIFCEKSEVGKGSRFAVELRLACAESSATNAATLAGMRVGVCVESAEMRAALAQQLQTLGALPVVVDDELPAVALSALGSPLDGLILGAPLLQQFSQLATWPVSRQGLPLACVVLVSINHALTPWSGSHGERYIPVSRVIKPSRLCAALLSIARIEGGETLPASRPTSDAERDATAPPALLPAMDVLIVEDNEINQTLMLLQLELFGLRGTVVSGGQEALDAIANTHFDVVLMDVEMPNMDGIETAERIACTPHLRANAPYIIAVTAHVMSDSRGRLLRSRMDDFVSKPVMINVLRAALARAGERRALS